MIKLAALLHKKRGHNADGENESVLIVGPFCSTFFSYLSLSHFFFGLFVLLMQLLSITLFLDAVI